MLDKQCSCMQAARSRQGKMEKSFLSFAATYPSWEPDSMAKQLLASLAGGPAHQPQAVGPQAPQYPGQPPVHHGYGHNTEAGGAYTPWGVGGLPLLAGRGGGPHPYGHHLAPLAWARAASIRRWAGGGRGTSLHNSMFGSAELTAPAISVAASIRCACNAFSIHLALMICREHCSCLRPDKLAWHM